LCSGPPPAPNVHWIACKEWAHAGADIVNTVDIVFGRLGYDLVAEALHCRRSVLAVASDGPEDAALLAEPRRVVPCADITGEQFAAGEWYKLGDIVGVERVPGEYGECATDGSAAIAAWIRTFLGDGTPRYVSPWALVKRIVLPVAVALGVLIMRR